MLGWEYINFKLNSEPIKVSERDDNSSLLTIVLNHHSICAQLNGSGSQSKIRL